KVVLVLPVVPCRLGETVVEVSQPAAGNMRHQALEHDQVVLVDVETEIEKMAQQAPALRHAKSKRPVDARLLSVQERILLDTVIPEERHEIADGREPDSLD